MDSCPSEKVLTDLRLNSLDPVQSASVRAHIDSCHSCRRTFDSISDSSSSETQAFEMSATHRSGSEGTAFAPRDPQPEKHYPQIDGFKINGVLGQGGMGIVYDAHQEKLNRRVALKVLPAIVANPAAVARFRREATAAARLHHTNIIPIYDCGESKDTYYYAMELVVGRPLNELITELGQQGAGSASATRVSQLLKTLVVPNKAPPDGSPQESNIEAVPTGIGTASTHRGRAYFQQTAKWMADAADALQYAHGEGIVHRDIKPANLILSVDGRLMIADFGLAKNLNEQSMTVTGSFMGSLRYASPEQAMARRLPVDHRTDVYSLGATMYELLCFQPAFPGDNEKEVLAGVISRDPTPPRKILPAVPEELETICQKAMEKSPDARYLTARALAEDLRRFLQDLPISAKRAGIIRRTVKFLRRHKLAALVVSAAIIIAGVSGLAVHQQRLAVEAEQLRADEEKSRRQAQIQSKLDSAFSFAQMKQWEEAEQEISDALTAAPNDINVIVYLIWMKIERVKKQSGLATAANYQEILSLCDAVFERSPNEPRALQYCSIALKNVGRYPEAIDAVQRVVDEDSDNYGAWANLGAYHALASDLQESSRCLKRAVDLVVDSNPDRAEDRSNVFRNFASLLLYQGRTDADQWKSNAIREKTTDVSSWIVRVKIGLVLEPFVDVRAALGDANYVDRLANERNPLAKRLLALAFLRNGNYEDAVKQAKLALSLGDLASYDHFIIAIAKARLGDKVGGRDHVRAGETEWPQALRDGPFIASYERGFLWFESAEELKALTREASEATGGTE